MKETPLIMSTKMVRAILDGEKVQTRRVVKLPPWLRRHGGDLEKAWVDKSQAFREGDYLHVPCDRDPAGQEWDETVQRLYCPYGEPGETVLWIKETWMQAFKPSDTGEGVVFLADYGNRGLNAATEKQACDQWPWRPSIFMPKRVCRLWLPLIGVRVERLQRISADDVRAEGFRLPSGELFPTVNTGSKLKSVFARGWDNINGERPGCTWNDNPWVWVLEFPRCDGSRVDRQAAYEEQERRRVEAITGIAGMLMERK